MSFSIAAAESIGSYVYALTDPDEKDTPFYVGKGSGDRCFSHALGNFVELDTDALSPKLETIAALKRRGAEPHIWIVAHGLTTEEAFRIESVLIAAFASLTNQVKGHYADDYWVSAIEIDARYDKPLSRERLPDNVLLVSLNGGKHAAPYPAFAQDHAEIAARTNGDWPCAGVAARVEYVFGVYRELIRSCFRVSRCKDGSASFEEIAAPRPRAPRRYKFDAARDSDMEREFCFRRIIDHDGKTLTKIPQQGYRFVSTLKAAE